jgi:hypothetical protein
MNCCFRVLLKVSNLNTDGIQKTVLTVRPKRNGLKDKQKTVDTLPFRL